MSEFKIGEIVKFIPKNQMVQISERLSDGRLLVSPVVDRLGKLYARPSELERFK